MLHHFGVLESADNTYLSSTSLKLADKTFLRFRNLNPLDCAAPSSTSLKLADKTFRNSPIL
jgi:hypothetical protein